MVRKMGCQKSRVLEERLSVENLRIRKYESGLKLSATSSHIYEAAVRRLLTANSQTTEAFEKIVRSLEIAFPPELKTIIEAHLTNEDNLKVLFVFFVLIGKGTEALKKDCIWYLYDEDLSDEITSDVLETMFRDIITASASFSLDALIQVETSEDHKNRLVEWKKQSLEKKERLVARLCKHFVNERGSVTKEEFELKSMRHPLGRIHSLLSLRALIDDTQVIPNKFANAFKSMKVTSLKQTSS